MKKISIIIPVYRGKNCLEELTRRIDNVTQKMNVNYEILLIDDHCPESSWLKIQELAKSNPYIKGVKLSRNFGQHIAITAGLDLAQGDWIVVMDCDLEDPPEEIARLYQEALNGYDIVVAKRKNRKHGLLKRTLSKMFYMVFRYLSELDYDEEVGNFRIISRKVVNSINEMREHLRFFGGLVHWVGFEASSIEIQHGERFSGVSSYTFRRLRKLALDTIIAYSDKPLKLSIKIGFTMSILSILIALIIFIKAIVMHNPVPGWSSLIVSIYFIGGIIIANLGVIGLYLAKTFEETKKRPLYIIDKKTFES